MSGYKAPNITLKDYMSIFEKSVKFLQARVNGDKLLLIIGKFCGDAYSINLLKANMGYHNFSQKHLLTQTRDNDGDIIALFTKNVRDNGSIVHENRHIQNKTVFIRLPTSNISKYRSIDKPPLSSVSNRAAYMPVENSNHGNNILLGYFNVGDLKAHKNDINDNKSYSDFDILILAETNTEIEDTANDVCLAQFELLFRYDKVYSAKTAKSLGILGMVKKNIKNSIVYREISLFTSTSKLHVDLHTTIIIFEINEYVIISGYKGRAIPMIEFMNDFKESIKILEGKTKKDKVLLIIGSFDMQAYYPLDKLNTDMNSLHFSQEIPYAKTRNLYGDVIAMFAKNISNTTTWAYKNGFTENRTACIRIPTSTSIITKRRRTIDEKTQEMPMSGNTDDVIVIMDEDEDTSHDRKKKKLSDSDPQGIAIKEPSNTILNGSLTDEIIHSFIQIANGVFPNYYLQDTLFYQLPYNYQTVVENRNDVQILYSSDHWICAHYTVNNKTVTDTLRNISSIVSIT